jgi:hypothetical protein
MTTSLASQFLRTDAGNSTAFLCAAAELLDPAGALPSPRGCMVPTVIAIAEYRICPRRRRAKRAIAAARCVSKLWRSALADKWRAARGPCPESCPCRRTMLAELKADTALPWEEFMSEVAARDGYYSISSGVSTSFTTGLSRAFIVNDLIRASWFLKQAIYSGGSAFAVPTLDAFVAQHVDASSGELGCLFTASWNVEAVGRDRGILREAVMDSVNKLISNVRLYRISHSDRISMSWFLQSWCLRDQSLQLPCSFISDTLAEKFLNTLSSQFLNRFPAVREHAAWLQGGDESESDEDELPSDVDLGDYEIGP